MFDDKITERRFLSKLQQLHSVDLKLGTAFGEAVRSAFAEKITSEKELDTYYLTVKDIQRIANEVVDGQLEICESCDDTGIRFVPNGPDDFDVEFCDCVKGRALEKVHA